MPSTDSRLHTHLYLILLDLLFLKGNISEPDYHSVRHIWDVTLIDKMPYGKH